MPNVSLLRRRAAFAAALCTPLLLGGCGHLLPGSSLVAGVSKQDDVIASQGRPSRIWPEADGGSTLEYATQPFGNTCFMFRIDAGGRLVSYRDALQPASRDAVRPGMTTAEVTRLLGQERRRVPFALSGEDVWDWNVQPDASGDLLRFNVHFQEGRVLRTSTSLEMRNKRAPRS